MPQRWQSAPRLGFGTKRPPVQIRPPRLMSAAWPMVAVLARRALADQQRAGKPVCGACPAAEQQTERRIECLPSILFLVIVAIVLGIVGVVVKGLLYLLFIGIVVFLVGLLIGAVGTRRRSRRAR